MKLQDVRKHNRKIERAYRNDELSVDEYFDQLLTIYKAVDTDEGLSARDKICFHYFNPNFRGIMFAYSYSFNIWVIFN